MTKNLYTKFEMDFANRYRPAYGGNPFLSKKPEFSGISIDNYGLVQVDFSADLVVPKFDNFDSSVLRITVLPSGFVEEEMLEFSWLVTSF